MYSSITTQVLLDTNQSTSLFFLSSGALVDIWNCNIQYGLVTILFWHINTVCYLKTFLFLFQLLLFLMLLIVS